MSSGWAAQTASMANSSSIRPGLVARLRRIQVADKRAVAVEYEVGGKTRVAQCAREIVLSASVGLTLGSDVAPDDLLRQAHAALTRAKADGSRARIEVHEGALAHDDVDALQLETDLKHALENEELRLFYQPIVDMEKRRVVAIEVDPVLAAALPGTVASYAPESWKSSRRPRSTFPSMSAI